jgi:Tat protein translocase TatB subunit
MNIFGVGTAELLIILIIALLVLGPERLPEVARLWAKFTRSISTFTRTWQDFNTQLTAEINREIEGSAKPKPARDQPVVAPDPDANAIAPPQLQEQATQPAGASQATEAALEGDATPEDLPANDQAMDELRPDGATELTEPDANQ